MALAPLLFFAVLAAVHTWPLASDPAHLRRDDADTQLNAWIVSWVAHQLPRDPVGLFDANIFFPERRALAFSEPLIPPGAVAVVPRALGASAVLTYNLLLMGGFCLTGLAGYALGRGLTGDRLAGLLAGSLTAFGPHTLTRLSHLQVHWLVTLPLALLAVDASLRRRTWSPTLLLGVCVALLAMTSGYGLALGVAAVGAAFVARVDEWWRHWRPLAPRLAAGAFLSLLLAVPVLLPYWQVIEEHEVTRDTAEAASLAALPTTFVASPSRLHLPWSHHFDRPQGGAYFPGVTALVLAGVALLASGGWRKPRARMLVGVALAGALLALGPATPLFAAFRTVFPPMRGLRDPSRFAALFVVGVGVLAALGLAELRRRLPGRWRLAIPLGLIALANAEVFCAPFDFEPYEGESPIYARLAAEPHRVALAEFPFYAGDGSHLNAGYVLSSTIHWTPLVNGYAGIPVRGYAERAEVLRHFPRPSALEELQRLGVSHLIVHLGRYRSWRQPRILAILERRADVAWVDTGPGGARLYRLRSPAP
jgi:hypothetical protein